MADAGRGMTGLGARRRLGLGLLALALAVGPHAAHASSYFRINPALERDERRSYSVASSRAICEAELIEFVPGGRWVGEGATRGWFPEDALLVRPVRWLKGTGGSGLVRVRVSDDRSGGYRQSNLFHKPPRRALLFLASGLPRWMERDASLQDWWLMESPYTLDWGLVDLLDSLGRREIAEVELELERQSPAALARESDLIVLAHPVDGALMRRDFRLFYAVDSVLVGQTELSVLDVKGRVPSDLAGGSSLLFLRREEGNAFTIVRTGAGSSEVRDGVARTFMLPLSDVLAQVRAAGRGSRGR